LEEIFDYLDQGWTRGRKMNYKSVTKTRNKILKNKKRKIKNLKKDWITKKIRKNL